MENGNPAPAAPAAPSPAAAPVAPGSEAPATPSTPPAAPAPAQPSQPATPPVEAPKQPTAEETAAKADSDEWDNAADELFPGVRSTQKKEPGDEPAKPKKDDEETPEGQDPNAPKKPSEDEENAGDQNKADAEKEAAAAARNARNIARQTDQQLTAMKTDVRAKVFPNVPSELQDGSGDPIRSVEDVMLLKDPSTGEAFTREAAETWFSQATAQFREQLAKVDAAVADISNVNLMLKDEADYINDTYGDLLKGDKNLADRLWAEYEKTVTKDPETGIIVKAPVSLQAFYDIALKPYADAAKKAKEDADAAAAANTPPAAPAAPAANDGKPQTPPATRDQKRTDRSDIYAPNNKPAESTDDKEWGDAARAVFGDQLKK